MSVLMELSRILICENHDMQIIELREVEGDRKFPILIGLMEAEAIRRRLQGVQIKRPLTHELLSNLIEAFGGQLESIAISDLVEHTFYATLNIRRADGQMMEVDSRPSDAIALGIAQGVPIYVAEHVLDQAQSEV
ncbi:MAG: bifunctional nuclease family protein [Phycisphaerales bacterium]|nr:bifunctional nuclease family protein [Phycisphaerales bacterium]